MRNILFIPILILSVFILTGCETRREQLLNDNWGKSFQAIKTNHVINPDAGLDEQFVEGVDGKVSLKAANKYHNSFDEKPPAQVTNISITGLGGQ